jgi:peroxiredoxin Q/BCP
MSSVAIRADAPSLVPAVERVDVGSRAPDFALPVHTGGWLRLWDMIGRKSVVLFFYPKNETPGCIREARGFRDRYQEFVALESEVVGVSGDPMRSHRKFADRLHLPFPLLSDDHGLVSQLYGIEKTFGVIPGRATFVIDRNGIVRHRFVSQFAPTRHVDEALAALRALETP